MSKYRVVPAKDRNGKHGFKVELLARFLWWWYVWADTDLFGSKESAQYWADRQKEDELKRKNKTTNPL